MPELSEYNIYCKCRDASENKYTKNDIIRAVSENNAIDEIKNHCTYNNLILIDYSVELLVEGGLFDAIFREEIGFRFNIEDDDHWKIKNAIRRAYNHGKQHGKYDR